MDKNYCKVSENEAELLDVLLGIVIVSANLTRKISRLMGEKKIEEGGIPNVRKAYHGLGNQ